MHLSLIAGLVLLRLSFADEDCTKTRCLVPDSELRFFLLGDWGGFFWWPYYSLAQKRIAEAMAAQAKKWGTHFQVSLGDNFYATGVKNVDDDRFKITFENIYHQKSLQTPWYLIMGNHDHYGNTSAQIAYTKKSSRWKVPSLYYTVKYETSDGASMDLIMIDTIILCGNTKDLQFSKSFFNYMFKKSKKLGTPSNPAAAEDHWTWIERQLQQSTADYLFIAGHYPILSIGDHGPVGCLDRLTTLMAENRAQVYMSGHDHNLQHIHLEALGRANWLGHQLISGAGAFISESRKFADKVPKYLLKFEYPGKDCTGKILCFESRLKKFGFTRGGYVYAQVSREKATFTYFRGDGEALYNFSVTPRN